MSTALMARGTSAGTALSFPEMMQMGDVLVRTGFLPAHLRTGAQVAAVILTGRELGMEPMRAVRSLSLVKGKVVESADSQLARFKADGGRAQFKTLSETDAVLWLRHPNGDEHTESFTMQDAQNAGLAGSDTYKKFPKAMLRSRVITAGLKSVGWEGAVGNYDPDELKGTPLDTVTTTDAADYVRTDTVEPRQLAAPALTLDVAMAMTVGKGKQALGDMDDERLASVIEWAKSKGNARVEAAATLVMQARIDDQGDDEIELLPGSAEIEVAA